MSSDKPPIKLEVIAKQRAEETAARQAKYNASIIAGHLGAPMALKKLSDLPFTEITRLSYIRGIMSCVESLWQESVSLSYSSAEWDMTANKVKARERVKVLEQAIELLKMIESV